MKNKILILNNEILRRRKIFNDENDELLEDIKQVLREKRKILTPRERKVLHRRFYKRQDLETVGRELGVTRERIRQIEAKGLERLYED